VVGGFRGGYFERRMSVILAIRACAISQIMSGAAGRD
jgi:hypothetical protein